MEEQGEDNGKEKYPQGEGEPSWKSLVDIGYYQSSDGSWKWINGETGIENPSQFYYPSFPQGGTKAYLHVEGHYYPGTWNAAPYISDNVGSDYEPAFGIIERSVSTPVAYAGVNLQIAGADQSDTVLQGTATDPDNDPLQYRWLEGSQVLLDWSTVGSDGEASLALNSLPSSFSIGEHILTLQVKDAISIASDDMALTIQNSPPEACPAPSSQTVKLGIDPIRRDCRRG